jgi:hypothetical protein
LAAKENLALNMDEPLATSSERMQLQPRNEKDAAEFTLDVNDLNCEAKLTQGVVDEDREKWSTKVDFMFSIIGYCVGIGNVWR